MWDTTEGGWGRAGRGGEARKGGGGGRWMARMAVNGRPETQGWHISVGEGALCVTLSYCIDIQFALYTQAMHKRHRSEVDTCLPLLSRSPSHERALNPYPIRQLSSRDNEPGPRHAPIEWWWPPHGVSPCAGVRGGAFIASATEWRTVGTEAARKCLVTLTILGVCGRRVLLTAG